jgi:hypothetical protein
VHEAHAVRACFAALGMLESVASYANEVQRTHGVPLTIRVGLNSGEVVVRAISSDLQMDYSAAGHATHLAARMEQVAKPRPRSSSPPSGARRAGTGRSSRWSVNRAWASRGCSESSCVRRGRSHGWCWKAHRCPAARPPRIAR